MDALDELKTTSIRGNHDRVVSGLDEPVHFNAAARKAVEWTREKLSDSLPASPRRTPDQDHFKSPKPDAWSMGAREMKTNTW